MYIASAALLQSLETFNFIAYNVRQMGEDLKNGGHVRLIDNYTEHSMTAELGESSFFIRALAANPDTQDSAILRCAMRSTLSNSQSNTTCLKRQ